jgi:DNA-directed RNA polymerase subunit H
MNAEVTDVLFRSRKTLLNILQSKGYDITPYEKFGPWEIEAMIINEKKNSLTMNLKKFDEKLKDSIRNCLVVYRLNRLKQSIPTFISQFTTEDSEFYISDPNSTEVYVIVLEPVNNVEVFHAAALNILNQNKLRVSFFQAHSLVNNPQEHILVPKHELISKEEIPDLKKNLNIQNISNLPFIRFHQDIQTRLLGAIPGDVIKITRPSPSTGEEIIYRVCVP